MGHEPEEDYIKVQMPRWWIDLAHKFRVKLHPRYADEHYNTGIVVTCTLEEIRQRFIQFTCDIDNPNQYIYPEQVMSAHLYLPKGKQLHVRVYKCSEGFLMKGHLEWSGTKHPIRHTFYSGLDYDEGDKILKKLWFD